MYPYLSVGFSRWITGESAGFEPFTSPGRRQCIAGALKNLTQGEYPAMVRAGTILLGITKQVPIENFLWHVASSMAMTLRQLQPLCTGIHRGFALRGRNLKRHARQQRFYRLKITPLHSETTRLLFPSDVDATLC